ncbi:hypothetical protein BDA99DRAFT_520417 [Phascolomyces articulosus]|uniref:Outer kinetochore protein DAM1 n=1 Tax=Phascolomyces articulosus TaxID=60185 RepID=A0AAD5K367_9FUNG|nr:hypothetical protein BDA99DRAFT_520417 [Phascolomyces articulosus]
MNVNSNNSSNNTTLSRILLPTTTQQQQEEEPLALDSLTDVLMNVGDCFSTLNEQMENLNQANESLNRLNRSFGAFLFAMTAHGSGLQYTHLPDMSSSKSNRTTQQGRVDKKIKKGSTRRFTTKIDIAKIIDGLPRQFREQSEYTNYMKKVLKALAKEPHGYTLADLAKSADLPQHKVTECLKELVHSKHVSKQPHRGKLTTYQLNPGRHPSK